MPFTPKSHFLPPAAEYAGYGMAGQVVYFDSAFGTQSFGWQRRQLVFGVV